MSDLDEITQALDGRRPNLPALVPILGRIRDAIVAVDGRLRPVESRLLIVDELPVSAPFGALIRVRGAAPLYLGNGPNQPLSKLVPSPV